MRYTLFFSLFLLLSFPLHATRHAILMGNGDYPGDWSLSNPIADVTAMCDVFKRDLGFQSHRVLCLKNKTAIEMSNALNKFLKPINNHDQVFFYYSGHGFTGKDARSGDDANYLLGNFDARLEVDSFEQLVQLSLNSQFVVKRLRKQNPDGTNVLIMDACRSLPKDVVSGLQSKGTESVSGFSDMTAPSGVVIAYATALGKIAFGDKALDHSVYTSQLLAMLKNKEAQKLNILSLLNQTGQAVQRYSLALLKAKPHRSSQVAQIPWLSSSPVSFCFAPPCADDVNFWALERKRQANEIRELKAQLANNNHQRQPVVQPSQKSEYVYSDEVTLLPLLPSNHQKTSIHGQVFQDRLAQGGLAPKMVKISGGSFDMGCLPGDNECYASEKPAHKVKLKAFAMGQYEVTNKEYVVFLNHQKPKKSLRESWLELEDEDSRSKINKLKKHYQVTQTFALYPVNNVSWKGARAYTQWLSGQTGQQYALPSEAQWEYAARAGTKTAYSWENEKPSCKKGMKNGAQFNGCEGDQIQVGSFSKNPWGLFDMAGNLWEWTEDCWHGSYKDAPDNGAAWVKNCSGKSRVLRGGSWGSGPRGLRSANRDSRGPGDRDSLGGFRLARHTQ